MRQINWNEPLTAEELKDLESGETLTIYYGGTPISKISMDDSKIIQEVELCIT